MAVAWRKPAPGLIHHSDRGCQYTSTKYLTLLKQYGMVASMSRKGDCYDNAMAESFFATIKAECVDRQRYETRMQARQDVFLSIEGFYNRERLHSSLGYHSPLFMKKRESKRKGKRLTISEIYDNIVYREINVRYVTYTFPDLLVLSVFSTFLHVSFCPLLIFGHSTKTGQAHNND